MERIRSLLKPYWLFLPLCFGVFIAADDQTVIVTVLPDVMFDLRVAASDLDRASWAITGYLIGYTAAMPLMGRVSDRFGYRNTYIAAMAVFMLGSAAVALSPDLPRLLFDEEPKFSWMVAARVFQAVGGGAVIPVSIAAAGELVDGRHRAIAYGLIGASAEAGGVIGPLWGGAITEVLSWEWAFWLNIPLALVVVALLARLPAGQRHPVRVDLIGAALFAAALALLTVALTRAGEPDGLLVITAVSAAAVAGALVWRVISSADPLFPRSLFRLLNFDSASIAHFLVGAALIIGMVAVPLMAGTVYGESALEGGLRLLRMTVMVGIGALIGGIVTQHIGPRVPALAGILFTVTGFLLMSSWGLDTGDPELTLHLGITGLGFGLLVAPVAESALHRVAGDMRGAASALLTVSRMVGMTAGLAVMTGLGTVQFAELVADLPAFSFDPDVQAQIQAASTEAGLRVFKDFFRYAALTMMLALPLVVLMTRRGKALQPVIVSSQDQRVRKAG
jgi:EmrB/QacA subfamily drug resistance transporter